MSRGSPVKPVESRALNIKTNQKRSELKTKIMRSNIRLHLAFKKSEKQVSI